MTTRFLSNKVKLVNTAVICIINLLLFTEEVF